MAGSDRNLQMRLLIGARDEASAVLERIASRVKSVGLAVATYMGAQSVAGFFGNAIRSAAELQKAMDEVGVATGATAEDLARLEAKAEELGASDKINTTATAAAAAMKELGAAGMSVNDVLTSVESVLAMAQGAMLDTGTSASIVASSLGQFGLAATDAARVADVLSQAALEGTTSVRALGYGLGYAGPIAHAAGMSIEDTAAAIAQLSNAGIDGERAGTAMASVLSQLADPSSKASQELAILGINTKTWGGLIEGLGRVQAPAASQALLAFGEAGTAVRAALTQGSAGLVEITENLHKSKGAAINAASAMGSNLLGAFDSLSGVWESLKQKLVKPLLAPLEAQVRSLASYLGEFAASPAFPALQRALVDGFNAAVTAIKGLLEKIDWEGALERIKTFAENASTTFREWQDNLAEVSATTGTVLTTMHATWLTFRTGVEAVATGVLLIIQGLAVSAASVSEILNKVGLQSDEANAKTQERLAFIEHLTASFKDATKKHAEETAAAWEKLAGSTQSAITKTAAAQEGGVKKITQYASATGAAMEDAVKGAERVSDAADKQAAASDTQAASAANAAEKLWAAAHAARAQAEESERSGASVDEVAAKWAAYETALHAAKTATAQMSLATRAVTVDTNLLDAAFTRLGITSSRALTKAAVQGEADFRMIEKSMRSGLSTTKDLAAAWEVWAQRAVASGDKMMMQQARQAGSAIGLRDKWKEIAGEKEKAAAAGERGAASTAREAASAEQLVSATRKRSVMASEQRAAQQKQPDATGQSAENAGGVARRTRSVTVDKAAAWAAAPKDANGRVVEDWIAGKGWIKYRGGTEYRQRLINEYRAWEEEFVLSKKEAEANQRRRKAELAGGGESLATAMPSSTQSAPVQTIKFEFPGRAPIAATVEAGDAPDLLAGFEQLAASMRRG